MSKEPKISYYLPGEGDKRSDAKELKYLTYKHYWAYMEDAAKEHFKKVGPKDSCWKNGLLIILLDNDIEVRRRVTYLHMKPFFKFYRQD